MPYCRHSEENYSFGDQMQEFDSRIFLIIFQSSIPRTSRRDFTVFLISPAIAIRRTRERLDMRGWNTVLGRYNKLYNIVDSRRIAHFFPHFSSTSLFPSVAVDQSAGRYVEMLCTSERPDLFVSMNERIIKNLSIGIYDGCKNAVALAEELAGTKT